MIDLAVVNALSQGRNELGLLLFTSTSPAWLARRVADGRDDDALKDPLLTKVCSAGLTKEAALTFLNARLACD